MNFNLKLIILFFLSAYTLTAQNVFKIKLHISKSTYIVGEPVQIGISIINVSDEIITDKYLGLTGLKLKDENGNDVQRSGAVNDYWGPLKNVLKPNEEDFGVFTLNDYWGKSSPGMLVGFQYFEPGYYTVKAVFFPKNQIYKKDSTQISFQVIEPVGEELIVFNRLLEILSQEYQNKLTKQNEEKTANDLRNLYEFYPNSVYSPYILEMLDALYYIPLVDSKKASWATKELVEKHPYSAHAVYMLGGILNEMKSDSEKIEYVKMIKTKSKGTLMEKIYEEKIMTLEKKEIK